MTISSDLDEVKLCAFYFGEICGELSKVEKEKSATLYISCVVMLIGAAHLFSGGRFISGNHELTDPVTLIIVIGALGIGRWYFLKSRERFLLDRRSSAEQRLRSAVAIAMKGAPTQRHSE